MGHGVKVRPGRQAEVAARRRGFGAKATPWENPMGNPWFEVPGLFDVQLLGSYWAESSLSSVSL